MGLGHGPNIVKDGLVFNIDAANPKSYPGSGTVVDNMTGSISGSLNGTTYSTDAVGSFNFDGIDDDIDFGIISEINGLTSFSFNIWLTIPSQTAGDSIAFGNRDSFSTYKGIAFSTQPNPSTSTIYFYFKSNTGSGGEWIAIPPASYIANAWNNFAITYDGSTLTAIVNNGTPITDNQPSKTLQSTANFRMGKDGWNSNLYEGNIGPMQIYNRALSQAEVTQNYKALKPRFN